MFRSLSLFLMLCVLAACADAANDDAETAAADAERLRGLEADLIEADRRFTASVRRTGLAGWITGFTPTGRMIVAGQSHVGHEGIRRAMLPRFADPAFSISRDPNYAEVAASGDRGHTVGRYEHTSQVDGETVLRSGTYLSVWRRQADGSWKLQADIVSPDSLD